MKSPIPLLVSMLLAAAFEACLSDSPRIWKEPSPAAAPARGSVVLRISGNVYPLGYYSVNLMVGSPAKLLNFDIDTGSDLTWLQCDAPCTGCTKPPDQQYKPHNNTVPCEDALCSSIRTEPCPPRDQCHYEITYADQASSLGVLVHDPFTFQLSNGTRVSPQVAFGCGYNQEFKGAHPPPPTAGVLGLGNGKAGIITQLHASGVIRNVLGHCLSTKGGGFLFFGDGPVPSSSISWVPMSTTSSENHYSAGPAELLKDRKPSGVKGLRVIFDSGSSYTYFNARAYEAAFNQIRGDLKGKPLKRAYEDKSLPVCWKGASPFKSVDEVKALFKPLVLRFAKRVQYEIPPEAYLVVTDHGNACLGVLHGTEAGLADFNLIGDVSMQGRMVVYDNEKKQIGWASANCNNLPKS